MFTGDATKWLMQNIITDKTSWLTDVDAWCGSNEETRKRFDWQNVEETYNKKISEYTNVYKIKKYSHQFLESAESEYYDFIYIDADHSADAVYKDAMLSWKCLKKGGIMAFDDYYWVHHSGNIQMSPRIGIDSFLSEYKDELSILIKSGQVWISKNE